MTVGYQGEPGAFSEEAAIALLGESIHTRGYRTFEDLVNAVDAREVRYGLLPCENSIVGQIAEAYDLLGRHTGVSIVDETTHHVQQCLIGMLGAEANELERVASHPVALDQCRRFLAAHPRLKVDIVEDTAGAVRSVLETANLRAAAIGSALAAERYGATVLGRGIQDDADNTTRFFLISGANDEPSRDPRRACVALTLPNEPGSLHRALSPIAEAGLNLRALLARPNRERPFQYRFYLEIDATNTELQKVTDALGTQARILGRY